MTEIEKLEARITNLEVALLVVAGTIKETLAPDPQEYLVYKMGAFMEGSQSLGAKFGLKQGEEQ
jgi:hypothetical protein